MKSSKLVYPYSMTFKFCMVVMDATLNLRGKRKKVELLSLKCLDIGIWKDFIQKEIVFINWQVRKNCI